MSISPQRKNIFQNKLHRGSSNMIGYQLESMSEIDFLTVATIACVASVPSKDRAKNGASKRGGGGEERKETLADKPRDFENRPHRCAYRHLIL